MFPVTLKAAVFIAAIISSGLAFAEPGLEEIAEMAQAVSVKRSELGKAADEAKNRTDSSPDWTLAELKRISSELDALDSEERKLDRFRSMISEGYGCLEGRCVNGNGKYVTKSGTSYEGSFVSEKRHGYGKFIRSNGEFFSGEWNENRLEGECTSGIVGTSSAKGECSYDSNGKIVFRPYPVVTDSTSSSPSVSSSSVRSATGSSESSSSGGWGKWVLILIAVIIGGAILENLSKKSGSGPGGRTASPSYVRVETGPLPELERPSGLFASPSSPPPGANVPPSSERPRQNPPRRPAGPTATRGSGRRNPDHVNAKGIPASGNVTIDT